MTAISETVRVPSIRTYVYKSIQNGKDMPRETSPPVGPLSCMSCVRGGIHQNVRCSMFSELCRTMLECRRELEMYSNVQNMRVQDHPVRTQAGNNMGHIRSCRLLPTLAPMRAQEFHHPRRRDNTASHCECMGGNDCSART